MQKDIISNIELFHVSFDIYLNNKCIGIGNQAIDAANVTIQKGLKQEPET